MDDQRSRRDISTPDVGIFPGLLNDEEEMADRPVSRGREYESGYAKLSLQGGHKDLIQSGGDENVDSSERRQKRCDNISEFNKISLQGGHKDLLRTDTEGTDRPDSARTQKACDTDNLSDYNKLAKTGGHKGILRMDVKPEPPKTKNCGNVSDYSKMALQGGHKDLLKLEGVQSNDDEMKPKKKVNEEDLSQYSKISLDGGHKDILRTDRQTEPEIVRNQKACDAEGLSNYNKLAKTGGHKNLLKMDAKHDLDSRKSKGCNNASDYSKLAIQGGHRDLLVIEANKPAEKKVSYQRTGGDWFEHVNNNDNATTNKNSFANKKNMTPVRPSSAAAGRREPIQPKDQWNGILPSGEEQFHRGGKKRFEQQTSQRSEAPFATYW